jgi:hypothetical protein
MKRRTLKRITLVSRAHSLLLLLLLLLVLLM